MSQKHIIRILDVSDSGVTFYTGSRQQTIDWPEAPPKIGDVSEVSLAPTLHIHRQLAKAGRDIDWRQSDSFRWRKPLPDGQNRMDVLTARHHIKRALRDYFHGQGFIEIDMPLLVRGTTPDAEVPSFGIEDRYLATSCEYQIKRMEIGGFDKIYTLTQNFRRGDTGGYRNPEFTMLEWARVGASLADIESDAENFIRTAWQALHGDKPFEYQGKKIDLSPPWQRQTVRDAITAHSGVQIERFDAQSLQACAAALGITISPQHANDAGFLFSAVFEDIQPKLGFDRPVFITEWPRHMTASADLDASGHFTQRSELFIAGIELSDGFPSLTDPARQRESFDAQQEKRKALGYDLVDLDTKFIRSLDEGFPEGAGMALGFDRLVMLLTNQITLAATLAFDWEEL